MKDFLLSFIIGVASTTVIYFIITIVRNHDTIWDNIEKGILRLKHGKKIMTFLYGFAVILMIAIIIGTMYFAGQTWRKYLGI